MIALHKDPEGTSMFSKQQRTSSSHSRPQNSSSFSLSVQLKKSHCQSTDHSTTSEVELLKKRINELESRLASIQEEHNSGPPVWIEYDTVIVTPDTNIILYWTTQIKKKQKKQLTILARFMIGLGVRLYKIISILGIKPLSIYCCSFIQSNWALWHQFCARYFCM